MNDGHGEAVALNLPGKNGTLRGAFIQQRLGPVEFWSSWSQGRGVSQKSGQILNHS